MSNVCLTESWRFCVCLDVPDESGGFNLLFSSGMFHLWSFSWTTTRASRLKSMPVTTASRPASSWANLCWHANTTHQRRCVSTHQQIFRWSPSSASCTFTIPQIKEKLLQLTDKRKDMIDKWEDRWEWLRLSEYERKWLKMWWK